VKTEILVEHDQGKWEGKSVLVLVALTNSVGGFEKLAPDAKTDDGFLHVFIVKSAGIPAFMRMSLSMLRGKLEEDPDVVVIKTEKVSIKTTPDMICNIDGDDGCSTPIVVQILKRHIEVLIPLGEDNQVL